MMRRIHPWLLAARLRTLPAAIAVGQGTRDLFSFLATPVVSLGAMALHVAVV